MACQSTWLNPAYASSFLFPRVLLAVLFAAMAASAQDPGQQMPFPIPSPGRGQILSIEGRVVRAGDGSNVAGAQVTLRDSRGSLRGVIHTRDGGSFQFPQVNPGRYTLTVWHQGYAEYSETIDVMLSPVSGMVIRLSRPSGFVETAQPTVAVWALQIPEKAEGEFNRGLAQLERGNNKRAVPHLRKAVQIYPKFAAAYAALGNAHQSLAEIDEARKAYQSAIDIDDTLHTAWLGLGTLSISVHRHEEAEEQLRRAISLRPDDWVGWYQLAELYSELEDAVRAEECSRRALHAHDSMPRIHILLINALVVQQKYEQSLQSMEAFLQAFPRNPLTPEVARKRDLLKSELARVTP